MQKIIEPISFFIYFVVVLYMGFYMYRNHKGSKVHAGFAWLALTLLLTDSMLMFPRIYAIWTEGIEEHLRLVGIGRIGQALILCLFYAMINDLYKTRFGLKKKLPVDKVLNALLVFRVVTLFFPQNNWFSVNMSKEFMIIRFIPLLLYALILCAVIIIHSLKNDDRSFFVLAILILIGSIFIDPALLSGESTFKLYGYTVIRSLALLGALFIGFKEVHKDNELSRY